MLLDRFQRWALVLAWMTPGLWAANAIISRVAPGIIEPYSLALGRWLVAGHDLAEFARESFQCRTTRARKRHLRPLGVEHARDRRAGS